MKDHLAYLISERNAAQARIADAEKEIKLIGTSDDFFSLERAHLEGYLYGLQQAIHALEELRSA